MSGGEILPGQRLNMKISGKSALLAENKGGDALYALITVRAVNDAQPQGVRPQDHFFQRLEGYGVAPYGFAVQNQGSTVGSNVRHGNVKLFSIFFCHALNAARRKREQNAPFAQPAHHAEGGFPELLALIDQRAVDIADYELNHGKILLF